MKRHVRKFQPEAAKRKAEEKTELLHFNKVPRLSIDNQSGGAVSTRSMRQDSKKVDLNPKRIERCSKERTV